MATQLLFTAAQIFLGVGLIVWAVAVGDTVKRAIGHTFVDFRRSKASTFSRLLNLSFSIWANLALGALLITVPTFILVLLFQTIN